MNDRARHIIRPPAFWAANAGGVWPLVLAPVAGVYSLVVKARFKVTRAVVAPVPVICVGNLVLGGGGKTPTALAVAARLSALGLASPHFLTRGYGGRLKGPVTVGASHGAADIGDEPLLLARQAPTHVARHRPAGAALAVRAGAGAIIMDDGYQNPTLHKDLGLLVVDGAAGIGNGKVFPAGPLREPLASQMARCAALVVVGPGEAGSQVAALARARAVPVMQGSLVPAPGAPDIAGREIICFSGIASPAKFHASLARAGGQVRAALDYGDHHMFTTRDSHEILALGERWPNALMLCTQKDLVRLSESNDPGGKLRACARAFPVVMEFADPAGLDALLRALPWG
ncbi:MAG: tetraacyldisaccharide 4'-kinase [Alphaproteobacteria bacterium]